MPVERAPQRNGDLPALGDDEELRLSEPKTRLYTGQDLQGEGVLHLTTRRLVWLNAQNPAASYAIDYPFVSLHAVSRDKASWPEPCLYCQLKTEEADENGDEEDEPTIPELRFVPAEPAHLQQVFTVFSEMSAMNPDPADEQANDSSDEDDDLLEEAMAGGFPAPTSAGVWVANQNDAAMEDADEPDDDVEAEGDIAMETDEK